MTETARDARTRARELVGDLYAGELRELEGIERDRAAAVEASGRLAAELQTAGEYLGRIRSALSELPARLQDAQLRADHLEEAEVQERHARLREALEEAERRYSAAHAAHERDAVTEREAAATASGRAYAVARRSEELKAAVVEELEAAIGPVLERSRAASQLVAVLQAYRR